MRPSPQLTQKPGQKPIAHQAGTGGDGSLQGHIGWWHGLVLALFFTRFFLPTEDAVAGSTLWIVGLWLLVALVQLALSQRTVAGRTNTPPRRIDGLDVSILILIGGQVASAVLLVATTGDKRAAVNMAWEWLCAGVVWFVMRQHLSDSSRRSAFVRASLITGLVLAGLGLWQHYVEQQQLVAEYGPLFDRLRSASGSEAEAIRQKLAGAGIPTEGPGLTLYEKRLRDSREPMGPFGLANTFGGCLAVWLVLVVGRIISAWQQDRVRKRLMFLAVCSAVILWTLLLTKSRTAMLGLMAGFLVLVCQSVPRVSRWLTVRGLRWTFIGLLVGLFAVGLLFQLGGLDRQVLSEAPKSLLYRLQYWQATARMIVLHPVLGVGPGNFRSHYLAHKLPEASEEIADPHNLLFDVASTGGVLSLVGLVGLIVCALKMWPTPTDDALLSGKLETTGLAARNPVQEINSFWWAGAGVLIAFVGQLLATGHWDDRLIVLTVLWFVVAGLAAMFSSDTAASLQRGDDLSSGRAALVTLLVHLLGAGGIAMPAVTQLVFVLAAMSLPKRVEQEARSAVEATVPPSGLRVRAIYVGLSLLGLAIPLWAWTGLMPVVTSRSRIEEAMRVIQIRGDAIAADRLLMQATKADAWTPDPWRHRAELAYRAAAADNFASRADFDGAVSLLGEAITRDPLNPQGQRQLGNWWLNRWKVTQDRSDATAAAASLQAAARMYPTSALIAAETAFAFAANEQTDEAVSYAQAALRQDKLNRQLGHVDRYLDESTLGRLNTLLERPAGE